MKKLIITGFEPFGGETINPSWEAVDRLPSKIGEYSLIKLLIPVIFKKAPDMVLDLANKIHPDAIICVGQAGGTHPISVEYVGINLRHAIIPDNDGNQPTDEPIIPGGNAAYFSTLPVRKMSDAINKSGILSRVSYSAGTYVCNEVLYTLLSHFDGSKTKVGFIHIPYSAEQNKEPFMDINDIINGLVVAIENIDKSE